MLDHNGHTPLSRGVITIACAKAAAVPIANAEHAQLCPEYQVYLVSPSGAFLNSGPAPLTFKHKSGPPLLPNAWVVVFMVASRSDTEGRSVKTGCRIEAACFARTSASLAAQPASILFGTQHTHVAPMPYCKRLSVWQSCTE